MRARSFVALRTLSPRQVMLWKHSEHRNDRADATVHNLPMFLN
jgi:hypothetical protein